MEMTIEKRVFRRLHLSEDLLKEYGFTDQGEYYYLSMDFMDGDFTAGIKAYRDGTIEGRVLDNMNGEEYYQLRMEGYNGAYVGAVREAYENILRDVADKCCSEGVLNDALIRTVLDIADNIPEGKVMSYGQIAKVIGRPKNARLVGKIMSMADRYGEHPCHRVVNSAGRTVPGWDEQRAMLEREGVEFKDNGCVDMNKYSI